MSPARVHSDGTGSDGSKQHDTPRKSGTPPVDRSELMNLAPVILSIPNDVSAIDLYCSKANRLLSTLYHCSYPGAKPLECHEDTTVTPFLGAPATSREPWWGWQPAHQPLVCAVSSGFFSSVVQTPGATRSYG